MKKLNYLLAPLLVVPLLASCNQVRYTITAEEWLPAIGNEGVDFLQAVISRHIADEDATIETHFDMSPDVSHMYMFGDYGDMGKGEDHTYIAKQSNGKYVTKEAHWKIGEEPEWEVVTDQEFEEVKNYFYTPSRISFKTFINDQLQSPLAYTDFKFNGKINSYVHEGKITTKDGTEFNGAAIKFENAKVKSYTVYLGEMYDDATAVSYSFEYKNIVPADPHPNNK